MITGLGRSPGEGNGNPLQYSCLENPTDGGAWQATIYGVANSTTAFSDKECFSTGASIGILGRALLHGVGMPLLLQDTWCL